MLCPCDVLPSAHTLYQLLLTIRLLYGRWSTSGPDRSNAHFLPQHQLQSKEQEKKEQTNKMLGVNSSAERELCNTAFPVYIYRLTLAWILAKILQRYQECQPILTGLPYCRWTLSPADSPLCSGVRCRLPPSVVPRQLPSSQSPCPTNTLLTSPSTSGHARSQVQNPLSGFAPKQTKESSAWRATYLVLHPQHSLWGRLTPLKKCIPPP